MTGLRKVDRLRKLLLILPCNEEMEEVLDTAALAAQMDDPDRLVWARSDPRLCGPDRGDALIFLQANRHFSGA